MDGLRPGAPRFDALLASVRVDGIREPLTVTPDWVVTDGLHRYHVARLLGITEVEVRVVDRQGVVL